MHALHNIHSALGRGGLLVDTQPVGAQPRVAVNGVEVGNLDMLEWTNTIADIDSRVAAVLDNGGLFELDHEESVVVTDAFDNGPECLTTVASWRDTRVPPRLLRLLDAAQSVVTVEQDVRLRVLRATTPAARVDSEALALESRSGGAGLTPTVTRW